MNQITVDKAKLSDTTFKRGRLYQHWNGGVYQAAQAGRRGPLKLVNLADGRPWSYEHSPVAPHEDSNFTEIPPGSKVQITVGREEL